MKKQGYLAALVFGLVVVVGVSIAASQTAAPGRQTWEYMLIEWSKMGEAGLQRLGAQGWELIAVDTEVKAERIHPAESQARAFESETYFYFKRPK